MNFINKISIVLIVMGIAMVGFGVGVFASTHDLRKLAIEHQCAQYNSVTGGFEWIEK